MTSEADLGKLTHKKNVLEWKSMRSKELSRYYAELLQREKPFAPEKYRVKVDKSQVIRESVKKIRMEETLHAVRSEILIMEENIKEWDSELKDVKDELKGKVDSLEPSKRTEILKNIKEKEEKAKSNWEEAFLKITTQYETEMKSGADQFLLKYEDTTVDNKDSLNENQKELQGRGAHRGRGHRGRGK